MIPVVFDANVVIAACGWSAEPYACVVLVARRRARSFVTDEMVAEWRTTLDKLEAKGVKFRRSPCPSGWQRNGGKGMDLRQLPPTGGWPNRGVSQEPALSLPWN